MKMQSDVLFQRVTVLLISITIGVLALFGYKLFSVAMPLLVIIVLWHQGHVKDLKIPFAAPLLLLLALLVLAGISIFWTPDKMHAFKTFCALSISYIFGVLFIAAILRADSETTKTMFQVFVLSGYILITLILLQILANQYPAFKHKLIFMNLGMIKPTGSILGLFSFVYLGLLLSEYKKYRAAVSLVLLICIIILTKCSTAVFAFMIALGVFILTYIMPSFITRFMMVASYSVLLLSPLLHAYIATPTRLMKVPLFSHILSNSFYHRIIVWEWYAKKFMNGSIRGSGLESARSFLAENPFVITKYKMTIHAHNNSLQAYVELGIVGGILYALLVSSFFYVILRKVKDPLSVAVCNATVVYALVEAQFTHNLWRNYWFSLLAMVAGLIILFIKVRGEKPHVQGDHLWLFQDYAWVLERLKFWKS